MDGMGVGLMSWRGDRLCGLMLTQEAKHGATMWKCGLVDWGSLEWAILC